MSAEQNQKPDERSIPGMMNRRERFAEPEHAEHTGATVRRIVTYFVRERALVICMLAIVVSGTLCGIYAPSLQSRAVDIIAGESRYALPHVVIYVFRLSALQRLRTAAGTMQRTAQPECGEADAGGVVRKDHGTAGPLPRHALPRRCDEPDDERY